MQEPLKTTHILTLLSLPSLCGDFPSPQINTFRSDTVFHADFKEVLVDQRRMVKRGNNLSCPEGYDDNFQCDLLQCQILCIPETFHRKKGHTLDFAVFMGVVTSHSQCFTFYLYRIPNPTKDTQSLKQENQLIK